MLDEETVAKGVPKRHKGDGQREEARCHDGELDGRLTAYRPLMPFAMASQSD